MPILKPLTEKQKRCVETYLRDLNMLGAYREVYGSNNGANALKFFNNPNIKEFIRITFEKASKERLLTVQKVLDGLSNVAFLDVRRIVDDQGELLALDELPEEVATAIGGIKITERWEGKGEDAVKVRSYEYRLTDRNPALTNLGRYFKMFVDVQQHDVRFGMAERMRKAGEKAKEARQKAREAKERLNNAA